MSKRSTVSMFLVLSIVILAIMACGGSDNAGQAVAGATSASNAPTQAPKQAEHFKVGQAVKVGDIWQVTVNSVKTSTGTDIIKPQKSGNVYLLIDVSMKNLSNQEQNASSLLQWKLKDKDGQQYNTGMNPDGTAGPDGKVEAASPLKGVLTYEVPASTKSFTLSFEADIVSSGQTIWDISI